MRVKAFARTVRRSVALPRRLVEEVIAGAPPRLRQNLNRLVTVALEEFAQRQRTRSFEESMAKMGADPAIQAECAAISAEFSPAESDGLKSD